MAKTLTRTEALKRSRERAAAQLDRLQKLIELTAGWEVATAQLDDVYASMYQLGLNRNEIAQHLEIASTQVPKLDDLTADDTTEEAPRAGGDRDHAPGGTDRSDEDTDGH